MEVSPSIAVKVERSTPGICSLNKADKNSAPSNYANCVCDNRWSQIAAVQLADRKESRS